MAGPLQQFAVQVVVGSLLGVDPGFAVKDVHLRDLADPRHARQQQSIEPGLGVVYFHEIWF